MKLLGWMHRKSRQNSTDTSKDFAVRNACDYLIGQPSLDDQQFYPRPTYDTRTLRQAQREHLRKSFAGLETAREEEEEDYEESSAAISELFHGFLAIGTLGSESVNVDPSTPAFPISVDNITEKETEVTENDLKLINDELEKVLAEDCCNDSSGRNSYVSAGRSSHCSSITLSGKPLEGQESTTVCPLQGYLFGSAVEMSETTPVAKKEHRTSLGELFQKTKMTEDSYGAKFDREDKRMDKEAVKSAVNLMKKILKKKMLNASPKNSTSAGGATVDSTSAETKLSKVLQKFHRKIHPDTSASTRKSDKSQRNENRRNSISEQNNEGPNSISEQNNEGPMMTDEDYIIFPQRPLSRQAMRRYKSQSNPAQCGFTGCDSTEIKECWIKTDDYLVLEL